MSVNATVLSASAAIWGYPLVQVGLTAAGALTTAGGTLNQWISQDQLSTPTNQAIVTPNYDTLYSQAFLDLTTTGVVVTAPTTVVDRYILFEFMDAYTNVFASTSRRNYPKTNGGGKFLVYGPNSPKVADESGFDAVLQAPTNLVWLLSRTEVKYYFNDTDLAIANSIQKTFTLTTTVSASPKKGVSALIPSGTNSSDPLYFWKVLGTLITFTPPANLSELIPFTPIGISAKGFNSSQVTPQLATLLAQVAVGTDKQLKQLTLGDPVAAVKTPSPFSEINNNWVTFPSLGKFGVNFGFRAGIAATAIAGNLKEDAVYYSGRLDSNGNVLKGTLSYTIDFPVDIPADAFWSITAYYGANGTLIQNAAGIYAVGSHSPSLVQNSAGFYRVQLQSSKPTQNDVNWLPTPSSADFYLILRFYQPRAEVLNNTWPVPWIVTVVEYGAISGSGDSPVAPVGTGLYSAGDVVKVSLLLIAALLTFII